MDNNRHWVGAWTTSPAPSEAGVGLNNHTLRMNPRVSIGGDTLRVRVSNAYGNGKLAIGAAYVGIRDKGPAIVPGSARALTFGGSGSATVAAGALVISDSVKLDVQPLADVAVTLYLPGEIPTGFQITGRYARQTNYISPPGNFAADITMPVGKITESRSTHGSAKAAHSTASSISTRRCATPSVQPRCCRSTIAATGFTRAISAIARWATPSTWRCSIRRSPAAGGSRSRSGLRGAAARPAGRSPELKCGHAKVADQQRGDGSFFKGGSRCRGVRAGSTLRAIEP
jgi:hypothetical protein